MCFHCCRPWPAERNYFRWLFITSFAKIRKNEFQMNKVSTSNYKFVARAAYCVVRWIGICDATTTVTTMTHAHTDNLDWTDTLHWRQWIILSCQLLRLYTFFLFSRKLIRFCVQNVSTQATHGPASMVVESDHMSVLSTVYLTTCKRESD